MTDNHLPSDFDADPGDYENPTSLTPDPSPWNGEGGAGVDVPPLYEEQGEQAWAQQEIAPPDDSPPLYEVEREQG
ncbi:MAG: hypothetical protein HY866_05010, partial [Chloroflexi bacterium]|nr:hypothetical protein [Chloroflexota bacterium]